MVIYDRTRRADHKYKNVDEKLTVLALLSTFRKPLAAHPARLSISTHFLSIANFRQPLTGISTGLAGSPAPTREAMHLQAHPQTIIVDQIVDHFLPLDMNDEAQLTFVLGT
jgi:hypothetical protein